ncbi:MAG: hypothetical protein PHF14_07420, partial [Verrucomicrobiota bacterium]|nr:hypothetical protein [Verrucomicrobiota bacterium]
MDRIQEGQWVDERTRRQGEIKHCELEVVRKGSRFPGLPSPFPSGEPRAEAQRRGGVFELAWGEGQCSWGQVPTRAGIDSDFDTGSDRDRTDRTDR